MKKTKILVSGVGLDLLERSGKFPCAVCCKGVGVNSILCSTCNLWVHKKCSGIAGRITNNPLYVCPRCQGTARPIDGRPITDTVVDRDNLDVENAFCYLGDMLSSGGGCDQAIKTRCSVAWGKFRKLLPILSSKHIPLVVRGKVFSACVRSALLHGGETWAPNVSDLLRLRRNDRAMVRWICNSKLSDRSATNQLLKRLNIVEITECLRLCRLRWYGHVTRSNAYINKITSLVIPGTRGRGRPRKTWSECVKKDLLIHNLMDVSPHDRVNWRRRIKQSLVLPTPESGTMAAP